MQFKKILKAAFKIKNLALLAGVAIVSYITGYLPFMFIGAAGYMFFVLQTLKDNSFNKEYANQEKIDNLRDLNSQCNDLYGESRKVIDRQYINKVKSVLRYKDELMELFLRDKDDYIKQKVIEQVINLAIAYINLISDYSQRQKRVSAFDINAVMDGINNNERKLGFLKDTQAIDDIRHAIEMDRNILKKIDEEKKELERTGAKLTFIDSTLKTFKHQILVSENTDDTVTEMENIINEAAALDTVLNRDEKGKINI